MNPSSVTISARGNVPSVLTAKSTAGTSSALAKPFPEKVRWLTGGGTTVLAALLWIGLPTRRRWSVIRSSCSSLCLEGQSDVVEAAALCRAVPVLLLREALQEITYGLRQCKNNYFSQCYGHRPIALLAGCYFLAIFCRTSSSRSWAAFSGI
jgi:hypothetical protein